MNRKIIIASAGLLSLVLMCSVSFFLALAVVSTIWNFPVPPVGTLIMVCMGVGTVWGLSTGIMLVKIILKFDGMLTNSDLLFRSEASRRYQ
jgi:hypothetical protein